MFDRFGRSIDYLRISVTDRCNLRCTYCMPAGGVEPLRHDQILSYEAIAAIARAAVTLGVRKIRLTGGEPLVRKGLPALVGLLRPIPGLEILAMTTNGTLLAPLAAELRRLGLDSVNISLDSLDRKRYAALTRGGRLEDALAGIRAARAAGLPVKLNTVAFPETATAERAAMAAFAAAEGCALQFIRHYDLSRAKQDVPDNTEFQRPPPCAACNRLRLLADGRLKSCLHSESAIRVDPENPYPALEAAVRHKPATGTHCTSLAIGQIGG